MFRKLCVIGLACLMSFSLMTLTADAQRKILGPYLWMIAKTADGQGGAAATNVDSLDEASNGKVTEEKVAKSGAKEGDRVGDYEWTSATLPENGDINTMLVDADILENTGEKINTIDDVTSYALIVLETKNAQIDVSMGVSSDESVKVWLNGEVVHISATNRGCGNENSFQDNIKVNLKKGNNLFMIKVSERAGRWGMHFGVGGDYDVSDVDAVFPIEPAGKLTTQ